MLKADIEKYTATAAKLTKEIAEHEEDIPVWNGDIRQSPRSVKLRRRTMMPPTLITLSPLMHLGVPLQS